MTPLEALRTRASTNPDDLAFVLGDARRTYRQLLDEAEDVARGLGALGVVAGDRVVLSMANSPELICGYYACFALGAIACPQRPQLVPVELAVALRELTPRVHLGQASLAPQVAAAIAEANSDVVPVVVGDLPDAGVAGTTPRRWEELFVLGQGRDLAAADVLDAGDPCLLIPTSGTTGEPRLVVHTPRTLGACVDQFADSVTDGQAMVVSPPPMLHISTLIFAFCAIERGIPMATVANPGSGADVLDVVERFGGTFLGGLPYLFADMVAQQRARPRQVDTLRLCIVGGDAPAPSLQESFAEVFGIPLRPCWGSTEAPCTLTYGLKAGQSSRVLPDTQVRIFDDGHDVAHGDLGELWLSAGSVSPGYWQGPGSVEPLAHDGWFRTGDLFRAGDDDELWFVDRLKNLIVRGQHVSPAEVEHALDRHPAVTGSAVVGVGAGGGGSADQQRIVALVTVDGDRSDALADDVLAFVDHQLPAWMRPDEVRLVDDLPRTTLGKVDRKKALESLVRSR